MRRAMILAVLAAAAALTSSSSDIRVDYGVQTVKAAASCVEAKSMLKEGKTKEAVKLLEDVIFRAPDKTKPTYFLVDALLESGEVGGAFEKGTAEYARLMEEGKYSDALPLARLLAMHSASHGKWDDAEAWGSQAVLCLVRKTVPDPVADAGALASMLGIVGQAQYQKKEYLKAALNWTASQTLDKGCVKPQELADALKLANEKKETANKLLALDIPAGSPAPAEAEATAAPKLEPNKRLTAVLAKTPNVKLVRTTTMLGPLLLVTNDGKAILIKTHGITKPITSEGKAISADYHQYMLYIGYTDPNKIVKYTLSGESVGSYPVPHAPVSIAAFPEHEMIYSTDGKGSLTQTSISLDASLPLPYATCAFSADHQNGLLNSTCTNTAAQEAGKDGVTTALSRAGDTPAFVSVIGRSGLARKTLLVNYTTNPTSISNSRDGSLISLNNNQNATIIDASSLKTISTAESDPKEDGDLLSTVFSPSGKRIALICEQSIRLHDVQDPKQSVTVKGSFNGNVCFSPNGEVLIAGCKSGPAVAFANVGDPCSSAPPPSFAPKDGNSAASSLSPDESLAKFTPSENVKDLSGVLSRALSPPMDSLPPDWRKSPLYNPLRSATILSKMSTKRPEAIKPFLLEETAKSPENAGLLCAYGEFLAAQDDPEAEPTLIKAVQLDKGRTSATTISLWRLSQLLLKKGRIIEAADCMAKALSIDGYNPDINSTAAELFGKLELEQLKDKLPRAGTGK